MMKLMTPMIIMMDDGDSYNVDDIMTMMIDAK